MIDTHTLPNCRQSLMMLPRIFAVLGLSLIQSSCQTSYEQALRLSRIGNISQLFETAIIIRNGRRVGLHQVLPQFAKSGDISYVAPGLPELAVADECSERLTTVEIPRDDIDDVNVVVWPTCTRVYRCGGCCATSILKCAPIKKRLKAVTVLKVKLWGTDDLMMDWAGLMQVNIEEHLGCAVVCGITPDQCNDKQRFDALDCSCRCKNPVTQCTLAHRWDFDMCTCVCKNTGRHCGKGMVFNHNTCRDQWNGHQGRCESLTTNDFQNCCHGCHIQTHQSYISHHTAFINNTIKPTTASTATRTSTTTASTTDPCATQFCPITFTKTTNDKGDCVCTPFHIFKGNMKYGP